MFWALIPLTLTWITVITLVCNWLWLYLWKSLRSSDPWPGAQRLKEIDPKFGEILRLIENRSRPYQNHYRYRLVAKEIYKINTPNLLQKFEKRKENLDGPANLRRLFHGTSAKSALAITQKGFQLPSSTKRNMFGPGIYFAECPLKSWLYSVPSKSNRPTGILLLCHVNLGNQRICRQSWSNLAPEKDLKPGLWDWLVSFGETPNQYDSVYAPNGIFGAVRVPEYVIYHPDQAIARYIIVCEALKH